MDPVTISVLGIVAFIILLAFGMHIGIAMAIVGFFGMAALRGVGPALGILMTTPYNTASSFSLAVIPLFILMGQLAFYSGISGDLYTTCYKWLGRFRGGLGFSTIGACALFSAICGSATATTATMGTVCLPEMTKYDYKKSLSTGMISAGGTMGILIPPSTGFIVYGTISGESIGKLFAAGIVPGIMLMIIFWITIGIITNRDPEAGPAGERFSLKERFKSLSGVIGFVVLLLIVLGGIFGGVISPSEGGGIGSLGAFVILLLRRRGTMKNIISALRDTIKTTAMIFIIMIGAYIFGYFLTQTRMPANLASVASGLAVSPYLILAVVLLVYVVLGCFVDSLPLVIILTPIFWPLVTQFGWNGIWFGVLMILCMQIGLITPPVGMCVYVMAGVAKDVPLQQIFKGAFPFLIALIAALVVVVVFPQIATWLPGVIR